MTRMTRARLIACSVIAAAVVCGSALAEDAVTSKTANLRAGPGRDYPVVTRIPPGSSVEVAGCLDDYAWCDVIAGPDRGWVYSGNLEYPYEGQRVTILDVGPSIGLPIVTFSVGPYWDNYYRGRPWYGRRSYWAARPLPPQHAWVRPSRPIGRPPVVAGRPPTAGRPPVVQPSRPGRPVESRPGTVQPRAVEPRTVDRRPAQGRPPQAQRPAEQRPARAQQQPQQQQPQKQKQSPPREGRSHDEKKKGPGGD